MRNSITKTVLAAVAALGMATAVATISTPAEAQWHGGGFHGGGFHGGFGGGGFHGGWRGGGWGGGWHGGWGRPGWGGGWGWRRAGWGPGWGGGWGGGCWNCGLGRRLGLGLRSRLGDRSRDSAARGRDRGQRRAAGLWRFGLLGPAAGLDIGRPLSWTAAREHVQLTSAGRWKQIVREGQGSKTVKREPPS